jgi:methylmalonyl-CoA mutase
VQGGFAAGLARGIGLAYKNVTRPRMTDDTLALASEFPPASEAQWRKLTEAALQGADFDKKLVSRTYDGLRVAPLYPRAKDAKPVAGRPAQPWQVMARVDHPDPAAANKQALDDLENGANGLTLVFAGSLNANGYGLDASADTIARALDGVYLDGVTFDFNLSSATRGAVQQFVALVKTRKIDPASVDMRASINPIGGLAATGVSPRRWPEMAKDVAEMIRGFANQGFRGPFAVADGRIIHNAGGSEAQELAFALAAAVDCLRALESGGVPLDTACGMIYFRLSADDDQFLTTAKFRAIRKLWARVEDACRLEPKPVTVAAETAWRMMTRRDPAVNMLRTTIAVAAAGIGGADNILALPHTAALGLPEAFARRIARNTQLVLIEEAGLAKVADPAAGSGAIEALTNEMARAAWAQFQAIDKAGGAWAALEQGLIQREVAKVRERRFNAIAQRKEPLTGTSDYPDLNETMPAVLNVSPRMAPKESAAAPVAEPLPSIRLAEPFEALRDKSDAMLKKTGARPKVFLANLGKLSAFTARAQFAKNFYEAGGIETVTNEGFKDRAAMVDAFKSSGAKLACLCSSDKVYEAEAADAAKALTAAGAIVYLAGRPGGHEKDWRDAGVKTFIFAGCDVLATLQAAHDILGVK